jgi:hypothetical protein
LKNILHESPRQYGKDPRVCMQNYNQIRMQAIVSMAA